VRLDGVTAGQVHSLSLAGTTIGRQEDAGLLIADPGISRQHAKIFFSKGRWWVRDLGSSNGSYSGGQSVTELELADGALLRFGPHASFRFQLMDARQEKALQKLYETSTNDLTTGAHNGRYLDDRLSIELAFAMRHEAQLSVLVIDVDHLNGVNESHGRLFGDRVLRHIARLAQAQLRTEDTLARYGADEFVILLRDIGVRGAAVIAERVRASLQHRKIEARGGPLSVSVSIGCAALEECAEPTAAALLALADKRLYAAKHNGRDQVAAGD
jgi:diguanylate cyclase (GGDEF)-like protein